MFRYSLSTAALTAALATGSAALADLTSAQLWAEWQRQAQAAGMTVSAGSRTADGGDLTLSGVEFKADTDDVDIAVAIDEIILREDGSGGVRYTVSDSYPIAVRFRGGSDEVVEMGLTVSHPALRSVATGDPGAVSYSYDAPLVGVALENLTVNGEAQTAQVSINLMQLSGTYDVVAGGNGDADMVDSRMQADRLNADIAFAVPEDEGAVAVKFTMNDLASDSSGTQLGLGSLGNPSFLSGGLPEGMTSLSRLVYGAVSYSLAFSDQRDQLQVDGRAASGFTDAAIQDGAVSYGSGNTGIEMVLSGSAIPLPEVSINLAASEGRLSMPLVPTNTNQDLALNMRMEALSISEDVWRLFDPSGVLPRDPANLNLALTARGKWDVNIFDPALQEEGLDGPPGSLDQLTVNELSLSLLGAALEASGAFDIDTRGSGPLTGPPKAEGALDVRLTGANKLIDDMISLGFLPPQQVSIARMMLGLFFLPDTGPDDLTSKIEITRDGSISANGQRIR